MSNSRQSFLCAIEQSFVFVTVNRKARKSRLNDFLARGGRSPQFSGHCMLGTLLSVLDY